MLKTDIHLLEYCRHIDFPQGIFFQFSPLTLFNNDTWPDAIEYLENHQSVFDKVTAELD